MISNRVKRFPEKHKGRRQRPETIMLEFEHEIRVIKWRGNPREFHRLEFAGDSLFKFYGLHKNGANFRCAGAEGRPRRVAGESVRIPQLGLFPQA